MTDRELFQNTFSHLHASADTLTEVQKRMNREKNNPKTRRVSRRALTLALAAALLLALGVGAYASGVFGLRVQPADKEDLTHGEYFRTDPEGNFDFEAGPQFPRDGLTFSLEGGAPVYRVEFCPGWLPETPNHAWTVDGENETAWEEGQWYADLSLDDGPVGSYGDLGIRYQICTAYALPDRDMILYGEYRQVRTEQWGSLRVTMAEMLYTDFRGQENYVILFSEEQGYLVVVGGSEDLETLSHIARELEIRQTDQVVANDGSDYGMLNIGRG